MQQKITSNQAYVNKSALQLTFKRLQNKKLLVMSHLHLVYIVKKLSNIISWQQHQCIPVLLAMIQKMAECTLQDNSSQLFKNTSKVSCSRKQIYKKMTKLRVMLTLRMMMEIEMAVVVEIMMMIMMMMMMPHNYCEDRFWQNTLSWKVFVNTALKR